MRRALASPLALAVPALVFACSFTDLDGFATGTKDGGAPPVEDARAPVGDATTNLPDAAESGVAPVSDPYGDAVRADDPAAVVARLAAEVRAGRGDRTRSGHA